MKADPMIRLISYILLSVRRIFMDLLRFGDEKLPRVGEITEGVSSSDFIFITMGLNLVLSSCYI